jgi:hypothetical protein
MVTLHSVGDYVVLILAAAGGGAIGGLAAALVPTTSPGVNKPRVLTGPVVGAIAAMAVLLVFPGTKESTTAVNGQLVSTTTWSLLRLVPVALISGWAGPKVLAVLQDRLLAVTKEAQVNSTAAVAKAEIDKLATANQAAEATSAKQAIDAVAIT